MKYYKSVRKKLDNIYSSSEISLDNMSPIFTGMIPTIELIKFSIVTQNNLMIFITFSILFMFGMYILFLRFSHLESKKAAKIGLDVLNNNKDQYSKEYERLLFKKTETLNKICNIIFILMIVLFFINIILFLIKNLSW